MSFESCSKDFSEPFCPHPAIKTQFCDMDAITVPIAHPHTIHCKLTQGSPFSRPFPAIYWKAIVNFYVSIVMPPRIGQCTACTTICGSLVYHPQRTSLRLLHGLARVPFLGPTSRVLCLLHVCGRNDQVPLHLAGHVSLLPGRKSVLPVSTRKSVCSVLLTCFCSCLGIHP
jgi:hypothetical protein